MSNKKTVIVKLTQEEADAISFQLSDWLCWSAGFQYGHKVADPFGEMPFVPEIGNLRKINIKIKDAMTEAEKLASGPNRE